LISPKIISKIKESNKIAIMSHIMPDGDNVGSSLALYNTLKKLGKDVHFILDDDIPKVYKFLKNSDKVERPSQYEHFDAVIALDCGDAGRLGKSRLYLENNFVINIDHHISNDEFGNLNVVDPNAAATAEIVYQIIKLLGVAMDAEISECLYIAIVTDTGQFQYSNTTFKTHQIAGELINNGVNVSLMFERVYQNSSKEKVMLMKTALDTLEFYHNDSISCITLTLKQMEDINAMDMDSDGIINLARDIECVEAAIFLKELEQGKIKVGLRSKKVIDMAAIALQFGGGGHVRAAGCTLHGTMEEIKEKILEAIIAEFN
jgi:bifunctional oligoribonuclease and PAP phosphatase NrnA